jgi:hypothetical protein
VTAVSQKNCAHNQSEIMAGTQHSPAAVAKFRRQVGRLWPETNDAVPDRALTDLVTETLTKHSTSAHLHCLLGDVAQVGGDVKLFDGDAATIYRKALEIDPFCAEAYEELGYLEYVVHDDGIRSERFFRTALACEERVHSYIGLAKALFLQGRNRAALRVLEQARTWWIRVKAEIERVAVEEREIGKQAKAKRKQGGAKRRRSSEEERRKERQKRKR